MRAVRAENTQPELVVRSVLHRLGYRFSLHRKDLPGKPDMVFAKRNAVIFVHGCFWHGHDCARGARVPVANRRYWLAKIEGNRERDQRQIVEIRKLGWRSIVVWECQVHKSTWLSRVKNFLDRF